MLELLRNSVKSWVVMVLLGLLVLSFAAWGIGDMLSGRGSSVAATVGDEEITTTEFREEFERTLRQFQGVDLQSARAMGIDQVVLTQLALNRALDQEARDLGVGASDRLVSETIREQRAFQNAAGVFDEEAYRSALDFNRMRARDFEEQVRGDIARDLLLQTVAAGAAAPRNVQEAIWLRDNETRTLRYIVLDEASLPEPDAPTEEELAAYHADNADRFSAPEYRQISYLWLRAEDSARPEDVTRDDAMALYEARADQYQRPERRNLEQIVFDTEEQAREALSRISAGENFEKIASERGLSAEDVALGYVTRDAAPADLAEAAFGEQTEGAVGPVQTPFGWTLINLRGRIEAETTPFESVEEALKREVAINRARETLPELANAAEDLRAAGATLLEVGDKENATSGVVTIDSDGYDPDGARPADLPSDAAFLAGVFSAEPGEEMDLADAADGGYYAFLVEEITPSALRPLDTVRDRVEAAFAAEARRAALRDEAERARERLAAGETLDAIAEENGATVETVDGLGRNDTLPDLPAAVVAAVFAAEENGAVVSALDGGRRRIVAQVTGVVPADPSAGADEIALREDRASDAIAQDMLELFRRAALESRDFQIYPAAVEYSLGLGGPGQ